MNQLNLVPALSFDNMYLIGVVHLGGARGKEISLPNELKAKQQILQIIDDGDLYDLIMDSGRFPCVMANMTYPVFVCVKDTDLHEVASLLPQSWQTNSSKVCDNKPRFV